jgi:hypothetical protein
VARGPCGRRSTTVRTTRMNISDGLPRIAVDQESRP